CHLIMRQSRLKGNACGWETAVASEANGRLKMSTNTWSSPVTGLTCHGCVETVTAQLIAVRGVKEVNIDLVEGGVSTVSVVADRELTDGEVEGVLHAGGAFALARVDAMSFLGSTTNAPDLAVDVLFFDGAEELDAIGPWEVLRFWAELGDRRVDVRAVSLDGKSVRCAKGLTVDVDGSLGDRPIDLLIVPGGRGADILAGDLEQVGRISRLAEQGATMASVCTGAQVLGAAGLLDGINATTHWMARGQLQKSHPSARISSGERWVDSGDVVTSAGVSAGIDMALHLVDRFDSRAVAHRICSVMEYPWHPEARGEAVIST
ncbi:DJ-1/PfpI family protein, partial [Brachybacterium sp. AOP42-B2-9]